MRLLQVIDQLNIGGAEKVFVNLTSLLKKKGIQVDAMIFHEQGGLIKDLDKNLKVFFLHRTNKFSFKKLYQAHLICMNYDIVHAHMRHTYSYLRLCQIVFNGKYKLVLHDHTSQKKISFSFRYLFKPKYYIGVSRHLTHWVKDQLSLKPSFVYLLPNTIVPHHGTDFTIKSNISNLFCVSNIKPVKNIEFGIELCSAFRSLTVFGNINDSVYYNRIKSRMSPDAKVNFISGVQNLSDYYNNFDLAIHTSFSETGPLVLIEYLAYGIPFIAYNTGEVAETVCKDIPMLFMETFDADEWVARIRQIENETDLSSKLKAVFNKYFNPDDYTRSCIKIYDSITSS